MVLALALAPRPPALVPLLVVTLACPSPPNSVVGPITPCPAAAGPCFPPEEDSSRSGCGCGASCGSNSCERNCANVELNPNEGEDDDDDDDGPAADTPLALAFVAVVVVWF